LVYNYFVNRINWGKLIISIVVAQIAGGLGAIANIQSISTWYITINKPLFQPPNWLFGPVWTILFLLMGISFYLIWNSKLKNKDEVIKIYFIQLTLNILWSYLFFGLQNPLLGLIEIVFLWIAILITIIRFRKISKVASMLLHPYLAWVTFATILNGAIWWLN